MFQLKQLSHYFHLRPQNEEKFVNILALYLDKVLLDGGTQDKTRGVHGPFGVGGLWLGKF